MKDVVFLGDRQLELTAFSDPTTALFDRLPLVLGIEYSGPCATPHQSDLAFIVGVSRFVLHDGQGALRRTSARARAAERKGHRATATLVGDAERTPDAGANRALRGAPEEIEAGHVDDGPKR